MDAVELKPTRRWPTAAQAAQFEHVGQGPAFADLVRGRWVPGAVSPHVVLPEAGTYGPTPQHLMVGDWLVRHQNAMWERLSPAMYRERYEPPGAEMIPLDQLVTTLPDPVDFRRRIMAAARARYDELVIAQGDVHDAADTFQAHRDLAGTREVLQQLGRTFTDLAKEVGKFQQDQLERVPGGVERLTVPAAEGDIVVSQDLYNAHEIDLAELQTALSAVMVTPELVDSVIGVVEDAEDAKDQREFLECLLVQLVIGTQMELVRLGTFKPQVTKVREFAKEQARTGADGLSAIISGTITTTRKARDEAKFTRKESKP